MYCKESNLKMAAVRSSNIEALRVVCILSVVAFHYFCFADPTWQFDQNLCLPRGWIEVACGIWGKVAINCFVIISSWFLCTKQLQMTRWIKLFLPIVSYKLLIDLVCILCGIEWSMGFQFFDFSGKYFVGSFMAFMLLIPALRLALTELPRQIHALIVVIVFLYSVGVTLRIFGDSYSCNYVCWFTCLFVITSWFRYYPARWQNNRSLCLICAIILYLVGIVSVIVMICLEPFIGHHSPLWFLCDANKLLAALLGFSLFFLFLNLPIGSCRWINTLASTTFGVLLIHAGVLAKPIWITLLHVDRHSTPIGAILSILFVYLTCVAVEMFRQRLVDRPIIKWLEHNGIVK